VTAHGALLQFLQNADPNHFQPMNVNFGLFPPLAVGPKKLRKREKNERLVERALAGFGAYVEAVSAAVE
jgi:methylenetetrahydrofolate--tRNA-(uracil-5-)-methyltransferase